jgi:hypothetical protein
MYQHYNYGIILIQKNASVHPLTFREDPDRVKKMWDEEEKAKRALYRIQKKGAKKEGEDEDEEMKEESEQQQKFARHTNKKHQSMFQNHHRVQMSYYGEEDDYDEEEESEDEDDRHQENVFNQQNAFGMNVFKQPASQFNGNGMGFNNGLFNPWGVPQKA